MSTAKIVSGMVKVGDSAKASVDAARRADIKRNHTAHTSFSQRSAGFSETTSSRQAHTLTRIGSVSISHTSRLSPLKRSRRSKSS